MPRGRWMFACSWFATDGLGCRHHEGPQVQHWESQQLECLQLLYQCLDLFRCVVLESQAQISFDDLMFPFHYIVSPDLLQSLIVPAQWLTAMIVALTIQHHTSTPTPQSVTGHMVTTTWPQILQEINSTFRQIRQFKLKLIVEVLLQIWNFGLD